MLRKIIKIDENLCNGCGLCADACHEGAIIMADGKARLLRDDYCDGLGDCLPACPTGAISFEEREAAPYDEAAVKVHMAKLGKHPPMGGCPGANAHAIRRKPASPSAEMAEAESQLAQWPVQIKLVPVNAPYFDGADLLIAADCAAYANANFHSQYMRGKITVIGCPKLDDTDYSIKLTGILRQNNIKSVTVVRMVVPCCGGLENAVKRAIENSGKSIPLRVDTLPVS